MSCATLRRVGIENELSIGLCRKAVVQASARLEMQTKLSYSAGGAETEVS